MSTEVKEAVIERAYVVRQWLGEPKVYQLDVVKITAKQVKVSPSPASQFNRTIWADDYVRTYRPSPELAIQAWHEELRKQIDGKQREIAALEAHIKTTPVLEPFERRR